MTRSNHRTAVIALYGNREVGFGFLAHLGRKVADDPDGFVDGMPPLQDTGMDFFYPTATEAMVAAHRALMDRGLLPTAQVAVHIDLPGGPSSAMYHGSPPSFGNLRWGVKVAPDTAPDALPSEEIQKAADDLISAVEGC